MYLCAYIYAYKYVIERKRENNWKNINKGYI